MSTSTWNRTGEVKAENRAAQYRVSKHGPGYRVEATVRGVSRDVVLGSRYFPKPNGLAVETVARREAHQMLLENLAAAAGEHLYLRVDGMPGYAQGRLAAMLPGHSVFAAYRMNHDTGVPTTVLRVVAADTAAVEAFTAKVEGRNFGEDDRDFGTAHVTVTTDVLAAVDSPWHCHEGVTYFAALAAHEATTREEG